ncbi:MAG: peptidylprolyl isomerase [Planctomycetota bacterium]
MRKILDKYQKYLLVILAVLLIGGWTILENVRQGGGDGREQVIGTLYGHVLTVNQYQGFAQRWQQLGLPFVAVTPGDPSGNPAFDTYLLLSAARERGVRAGADAVTVLLHKYPPVRVRIEYVLADPELLAKNITPSDAELRAHYDAHWKDKSEKFEKVKDRVRDELKTKLARQAAADKMDRAVKLLAAAPAEGPGLKDAFGGAAAKTGLDHGQSPELFTDKNAQAALGELLGLPLPDGLAAAVFAARAGEPSKVWKSNGRAFVFRLIETSAGMTSKGTLFPHDEGWRNGKFMITQTYPSYETVIQEKLGMDVALVRQAFEEHLVVEKFLSLVCGGTGGRILTTSDDRGQWAAAESQEVKALVAEVPVDPFVQGIAPPSRESVLDFYEKRKQRDPRQTPAYFGYIQPERIQIEYVAADHEALGRAAAETKLNSVRRRAQDERGAALPLEPLARAAGLSYRKPRPFAPTEDDMRMAVPDLIASREFIQQAFSPELRPLTRQVGPDTHVVVRRFSEILTSGRTLFVFRLVAYQEPYALPFDDLSPGQQQQVRSDCAHALAVERARIATGKIKAKIARQLIARIAAENGFAVKSNIVQAPGSAEGAVTLPPALADHITQKLESQPGATARLVQDGDTYYTAAVYGVDDDSFDRKADYISFTAAQFTAVLRPSQDEIDRRARKIRDAMLNEKPDDADGQPPPEPAAEQIKLAEDQLIEEWKKEEFRARYLGYLGKRLEETFRNYFESNPLELPRTVRLEQSTTGSFFHADDEFLFRNDPALVAAAFKLKPNILSAVLTGDSGAAIMLLGGEETRNERKIEFVSIQPEQYGPLSVTATDADAAAYYKAHRDDFKPPPSAKAELLSALFDDVGRAIAPSITVEEIEAHYKQNAHSLYQDNALDDRLRDWIRSKLAREKAEAKDAEQAIRAAYRIAQGGPMPLAQVAETLEQLGLTTGTTPVLAAADTTIARIGPAPELIKNILAAAKGKLSEPVRTGSGWVIFRVTETRAGATPELKDIMPAVRANVRRERLEARATSALEKLRTYLATHPKATIESALAQPEFAAELPFAPYVKTTGFFDKERAEKQVFMTKELGDAVFQTQPGATTPVVNADGTVQFARVVEAGTNRVIKIHYVRVGTELFAPTIKVSDEDAETYYTAHKQKYERPRRYELKCLFADMLELGADIEPGEADVAEAYEQLKGLFPDKTAPDGYQPLSAVRQRIVHELKMWQGRKEAAKLAQDALALIAKDAKMPLKDVATEAGKLRVESVAEYLPGSNDVSLGLLGVAGLDAFLASAKAGDTSPAFCGASGPVIVRVVNVLPAGVAPFDKVANQVKGDVALERALTEAQKLADKVRAKITRPTAAAMQAAAAEFTVDTADVTPLTADDIPYLSRKQPGGMYLLSLRAGEIGGPERPAETARSCSLALVTDIRRRVSPETAFAGELLGWYARQARLAELLRMINADIVQAPGAR